MQSLRDIDPQAFARYMAKKYPPEPKAPTLEEALKALRDLEWACSGVEYMESEYAEQLAAARALLARIPA